MDNKEEKLIVCPVGYHKNGECRCDEKVLMDNNKEEVIFTNEPRLLSKGDSRFTIDSQSPLWKALEGNNEAQNQLREMIEKIFPSHQSPVSDRTQAFGKNKGGSPIPYSDFQMIKVETRSENLSGMEIKLSPVSEEWEERFEKEIIDYFWDRETVIGTQRLSLNHINKIKDFIRKQRQEAYEEGLKERCQNMLSKEETYLKAQHELAEEIMDYMENGLDEPTDWYVSVKNFLLSRGLLPKITENNI